MGRPFQAVFQLNLTQSRQAAKVDESEKQDISQRTRSKDRYFALIIAKGKMAAF